MQYIVNFMASTSCPKLRLYERLLQKYQMRWSKTHTIIERDGAVLSGSQRWRSFQLLNTSERIL